MKKQTPKSKKPVLIALVVLLLILAFAFYELVKFKPLPPLLDEQGEITSDSLNGFRSIPAETKLP